MMYFPPGMSALRYDPGGKKWPHIFLHVNRLQGWEIGISLTWLAMMRPLWICSIFVVYHLHTFFPLIFHIFFLLLRLLRAVPPFYVILWDSLVSTSPPTSCNPVAYTLFKWMIFIVLCAYLFLSWHSFVWMSRPRLFCVCHGWIIGLLFFKCWWIGCHIYFSHISFQNVKLLFLSLLFLVL